MFWIPLSALSGITQSFSNSLSKKGAQVTDAYSTAWANRLFSIFILLPIVLVSRTYHPLNQPLLFSLIFIGVFNSISSILLVKAVQSSPVSLVLPLLGFTPVFLLITVPLINKESVPLSGVFGVLLIVVGSYVLNIEKKNGKWFLPLLNVLKDKGSRYILMVSLIYAVGSSVIKIGLNHSNPLFLALLISFSIFLGLSFLLLIKRISPIKIFKNTKTMASIGISTGISNIFQNLALEAGPTTYVFSLKRIGILFNALFGKLLYGETRIKQRLSGAFIILLGILVISLS